MLIITGGSGKLGRALRSVFPKAVFPTRDDEFDLLQRETVESYVKIHRPSAVLHAAAYTNVRGAEAERELCWNTNVRGTEFLVEALRANNPSCYFVYVSTACVFYGNKGFYTEMDIPYPKNFYGLTKLVGEYLARRLPCHLIIRTNFVEDGPWPYPKAFTDRFGTYLYTHNVAHAIRDVMSSKMSGILHVTGDRKMSMFEMASVSTPSIEPISVKDVSLPLTVDMTLRSVRIRPYRLTKRLNSFEAL